MFRMPPLNTLRLPSDLDASMFQDADVLIHDLYLHCLNRSQPMVRGRIFSGCRIIGPAVVMVASKTTFMDCNFGDGRGKIANLLLRPLGDTVVGAVPLVECGFESCTFVEVGFTGAQTFLDAILAIPAAPEFGSLS